MVKQSVAKKKEYVAKKKDSSRSLGPLLPFSSEFHTAVSYTGTPRHGQSSVCQLRIQLPPKSNSELRCFFGGIFALTSRSPKYKNTAKSEGLKFEPQNTTKNRPRGLKFNTLGGFSKTNLISQVIPQENSWDFKMSPIYVRLLDKALNFETTKIPLL